jgi:hypothetical protein
MHRPEVPGQHARKPPNDNVAQERNPIRHRCEKSGIGMVHRRATPSWKTYLFLERLESTDR